MEATADGKSTLGSLYEHYFSKPSKSALKDVVNEIGGLTDKSSHADRIQTLRTNQEYGAAMARVQYWQSSKLKVLPQVSDVKGMAYAWFNAYNSPPRHLRARRAPKFPNQAMAKWKQYNLGQYFGGKK
jgi:hypothetical protein